MTLRFIQGSSPLPSEMNIAEEYDEKACKYCPVSTNIKQKESLNIIKNYADIVDKVGKDYMGNRRSRSEIGASLVEYALLVALIAVIGNYSEALNKRALMSACLVHLEDTSDIARFLCNQAVDLCIRFDRVSSCNPELFQDLKDRL